MSHSVFVPIWYDVYQEGMFASTIFHNDTCKNITAMVLKLADIALLKRRGSLARLLTVVQGITIQFPVTLRPMEPATELKRLLLVFRSILTKYGNFSFFNKDTSRSSACCVVGPCTLLVAALETRPSLGAAEQALEIKPSFADIGDVCDDFVPIHSLNPGLRAIKGTHAMSLAIVVGGQQLNTRNIMRAKTARWLSLTLETQPDLLGLLLSLIGNCSLAFPSSRLESDSMSGSRCGHPSLELILVFFVLFFLFVLRFFVICFFTS
jgi:hypothetical protein